MQIFFLLFFCVFIYILVQNIGQFIENENSPVLTEAAALVCKRRHTHTDANHASHTSYYAEFELAQGGGPLKCVVPRRVYKELEEGAHGLLTHQGTRFRSFQWDGHMVEK